MAFEINTDKAICCKCGIAYGRKRGFFQVSYGALYKGSGFLPYCKKCVDEICETYYAKSGRIDHAVRQTCRALNLYWNKRIFDSAEKKATQHTIMAKYVMAINAANYAGKSYDDTLSEEGSLWDFVNDDAETKTMPENDAESSNVASEEEKAPVPKINVTKRMIKFWGSVYPPEMIAQLEERYQYWMSRLPDEVELDIGTELLLKQISALDIDINNARAGDGKNVDKLISTQSNLLRDLNLKPVQRKKDESNSLGDVPFGVGIGWCERRKPIAEPSEEFKDVDGIKKEVNVWLYGHLAKMMGKKNLYSKLYEEEIAKLRVERPEFADESDEELLADVLSSGNDDGGDEDEEL